MDTADQNKLRVVPYMPELKKLTGSVISAILLAQLWYWWERRSGPLLYKTDNELATELGIGVKAMRNAKKLLIDKHFVTTRNQGIPQRTYYKVMFFQHNLEMKLAERDKFKCSEEQDDSSQKTNMYTPNGETNSYNTHKNTQKMTTEKNSKSAFSTHARTNGNSLLSAFLSRWQTIIDQQDWPLHLAWHQLSPELDEQIISTIDEYGGIDALMCELEARCNRIASDDPWREFIEHPVNLPFLLNAEPI
ncbi:hypothetical protein [Kistimonas asteriae]|uniref:hypothetical protein n=1 Tax=Kistimonas asteriae TaxID=517724 RepID=UPI001BA83588|nr:hypothetical protein [Kistimonas asteriae]